MARQKEDVTLNIALYFTTLCAISYKNFEGLTVLLSNIHINWEKSIKVYF